MRLSRFALSTYQRDEPPDDAMVDSRGAVGLWSGAIDQLDVRIGVPVRRRRVLRSQATRRDRIAESVNPSQGDGWTCPRCRIVNATNVSACRCGALRVR